MKDSFLTTIQNEYGFLIQGCREAARGQVAAETYILLDKKDRRYFCKITDRPDFISMIGPTLPVVREMNDKGLSYVCAPVPTKNGLSVQANGALIVLYEFIDAKNGYDYDLQSFGKALGTLHALTPRLTAKLPLRGFSSLREEFLIETLPRLTSIKTGDDVCIALGKVLQKYADETRVIIDTFFRLKEVCNQKNLPFVNTHGDIHGNVLVRSPEDFYIIDWDEMENGPAERDLWLLSEKPEFLKGYKIARPDFTPDADALNHALLKNYLEGIPIYLSPILNEKLAPETRLEQIEKLESKRFNGWMKPRIRQIIDGFMG